MIDKRRVAALFVQGVGTEEIANTLGCDPSYVSQLREDGEIARFVEEERGAITLRSAEFDDRLDRAEEKALEIIERNLPFANPNTALKTFHVLNTANRRKAALPGNSNNVAVQVTLILPQSALPQYVTNERKEIIEVEGRTMLSATPSSIEALAEARAGRNAKNIPKLTAVEQAAARLGALGPVPAREPRKSPIPVFNPRTVTADQL